jgi:hypothetical protein
MMGRSRIKSNLGEGSNSRARMEKSAINYSDWNYRFFRERHLLTLYEFQRAATSAFYSSYSNDHLRK